MDKKICLITGANSGIGYELAKGMAQKDYQVVMLCRNQKAGHDAKEKIIASTGNPNIDLMITDLSSQKSLRESIAKVIAKYDHLDVLFNNAGANFFSRQLSVDNIEMTFALNYLAPFLMTNLLLPLLKKSKSARIITTMGHINNKIEINFKDINFEDGYSVTKTASHAILAKYLFTTELSRRIGETAITTNCFFPGATKTELQKKMPFLWRMLMGTMRPFFISAKKGAEPGIFLATSDKVEKVSGKYFNRFKEKPIVGISNEAEMANQLWILSENMSNLN
jgi:NAD(P)-dependent dehydrogenase (short-subunit alcohol dehydrogenase family)